MHFYSILIVVLCLYLVQGQRFAPSFTTPVFMWSNTQYFGGKNVHISEYTSVEAIANLLVSNKKEFSGKTTPEAVFIFIEPELRTEHFPLLSNAYAVHPNGGSFSQLKEILENTATSSLVIPFVHGGDKSFIGSTIVMQYVQQFKESVINIASADSSSFEEYEKKNSSRVIHLSLDSLKNMMNNNQNLFSNGVTDIIVVCFNSPVVHADNVDQVAPSYAADDTYIKDIIQNIQGSYIAILTSERTVSEGIKLTRATMMVRQLTPNEDSGGIYPGDVVEAHIVLIPFAFILAVGICCTCSVQSDLKFDAEKKTFKR